jgi:hypothetical protein
VACYTPIHWRRLAGYDSKGTTMGFPNENSRGLAIALAVLAIALPSAAEEKRLATEAKTATCANTWQRMRDRNCSPDRAIEASGLAFGPNDNCLYMALEKSPVVLCFDPRRDALPGRFDLEGLPDTYDIEGLPPPDRRSPPPSRPSLHTALVKTFHCSQTYWVDPLQRSVDNFPPLIRAPSHPRRPRVH